MIDMFMCHKNRIEVVKAQIKLIKPFPYSLHTDSCIDQDVSVVRSDIGTVTTASTGNTGKTHQIVPLLPIYFYLVAFVDRLQVIGSLSV